MDPVVGHLAGGDEGAGRLPEPADIVALVDHVLQGYRGPLSGKRLLITAGGTSEAIDPVRVVTNRSSGHQGYALAEVAARMGAAVTLVSASDRSFALDVARQVSLTKVTSAAEMAEVVLREAAAADVIIMAAAVSDFTVAPATEKLKKSNGMPTLTWSPTVDILATILERRRSDQIIVGFAAETTDVATNAQTKLAEKPVDILVVNDVSQPGVGFQAPTNAVTLMGPSFDPEVIGITSKEAISELILTRVSAMFERGAQ